MEASGSVSLQAGGEESGRMGHEMRGVRATRGHHADSCQQDTA